jgi:hypothetical protein
LAWPTLTPQAKTGPFTNRKIASKAFALLAILEFIQYP